VNEPLVTGYCGTPLQEYRMPRKPKIAMYWAASCGGCEIALVNLHEKILALDAAFEFFFCPCLLDTKIKDLEALDDGELAITLFNGGIRTEENRELARLLRQKSQILIAFGSCASAGCIPSLGNLNSPPELLKTIYLDNDTVDNAGRDQPRDNAAVAEGAMGVPAFLPRVLTLSQVVPVDYSIPGCPPESQRIWEAIGALTDPGGAPPQGTVLGAGLSTVCQECRRERGDKKIARFFRNYEIIPDDRRCLLEQGLLCLGIATRDGCGGLCMEANMPCSGCYGPPPGRQDQGALMTAALGSILDLGDTKGLSAEELRNRISLAFEAIPDWLGTFYKYSLAGSILGGREKT
jgi:F420-non-reducing hydrogenase small subunit